MRTRVRFPPPPPISPARSDTCEADLLLEEHRPSRPVAGYVVDDLGQSHRHYWAEFYLESFGWVPVDPYLGDGQKYGGFPMEEDVMSYYFGNLDKDLLCGIVSGSC
jgi:hypothetical protein